MSTYVYITQNEYDKLINSLKSTKNFDLIESIKFQYEKSIDSNPSYKLAAKNLLSKLDNKLFEQDELLVDEDAIVSENDHGAYVQCWVWVNSQQKSRKSKKGSK